VIIESRKDTFKNLWIEKYRPSHLNEVILDPATKQSFQQMIDSKEVPHLLLAGKPGTGKTTIAFILINYIIKHPEQDVLELNGSAARGIDIVRNTIEEYCKSPPGVGDKIKIVFIDEADKITADAQDALRNIIETYSENVRFIMTCNYLHKISDALKSRLQTYIFKALPKDQILNIVSNILDNENIIYDQNELVQLIDLVYPDIRKLLNEIQKYIINDPSGIRRMSLRNSDGSYFMIELDIVEKIITIWKYTLENNPNTNKLYLEINKSITENVVDFSLIYRILFDKVQGLGLKALISEYANKNDKVMFQDMNLIELIYKGIITVLSNNKR